MAVIRTPFHTNVLIVVAIHSVEAVLVAALIGPRAIRPDGGTDDRAGSHAGVRGEGLVGGIRGVDLEERLAAAGFSGVPRTNGVALGDGNDGIAGCVEGVARVALHAKSQAKVVVTVGELGAVFGSHVVLDRGAAARGCEGVFAVRGIDLDATK